MANQRFYELLDMREAAVPGGTTFEALFRLAVDAGLPARDAEQLVSVLHRLKAAGARGNEGCMFGDAQLGGDEFAIIQSGLHEPTVATSLALRLIAALSEPYHLHGHQVVVGTSIGIAVVPNDGNSADQVVRNADLALYRAKADGRGCHRFFEPEMDALMQARRLMEVDLRRALLTREFHVVYQPLIHVRSGTVAAVEALIRWRHPERGMISPAEFIPLAEQVGLIVPIGAWVLLQACRDAASWPENVKVAVNLSPVQLGTRTLVQDVAAALEAAGLAPARLELEITGTAMLEDTDATLATLRQLRALGVSIAMDDFRTGYSSLTSLRRFPFEDQD